jgi:hypothetical protein
MILNRFKYSPAFVTGFGAAVLTTIPGFKDFACCMLIPAAELNIGDAAENSINLMRNIAKEITENGYSIALTSLLLFSNLFIYILFGMMGGLIGLTLINKKFHNKEN